MGGTQCVRLLRKLGPAKLQYLLKVASQRKLGVLPESPLVEPLVSCRVQSCKKVGKYI